jgi:hypothetical protein
MRYPKVGETFYWKGCHGDIHQDVCMKIEKQPGVMRQYFNYISENGGGTFVNEKDILDPDSEEVKEYEEYLFNKKIKEFWTEDMRILMYERLTDNYIDGDIASEVLDILCEYKDLNILSKNKNYE